MVYRVELTEDEKSTVENLADTVGRSRKDTLGYMVRFCIQHSEDFPEWYVEEVVDDIAGGFEEESEEPTPEED